MLYEVPITHGWEELFHFDALPMWSHHPFTMCYRRQLGLQMPYQSDAGIADDTLFLWDSLQKGKKLFVIPESLFEWRSVEIPTNGYIGLSSERKRISLANRAVWRHILQRYDLREEVRALLVNPVLIHRLFGIKMSAARRLAIIARDCRSAPIPESHPLLDPALHNSASLIERVMKLYRVTRILGWMHLANVLKFYIDKRLYWLNTDRHSESHA
jgi:hypothetical protein